MRVRILVNGLVIHDSPIEVVFYHLGMQGRSALTADAIARAVIEITTPDGATHRSPWTVIGDDEADS